MRVSRPGYYGWLKATPSNRSLENNGLDDLVSALSATTNSAYGRRRLCAQINTGLKKPVSVNRIERRMKAIGVKGYQQKSYKRTTIADPLLEDSPNLVADAKAQKVDEIYVSDITYVATNEGWLYLCVVIDLFSRKVVGWSTRNDMKAELVVASLRQAFSKRKPMGKVIFHSDKGGQYKSKKLRRMLKRLGFDQSMTGVNHCYDNAHAESFFATLKRELIRGKKFESRDQAETAIFEYIEVFYNRIRMHSSLNYLSPNDYEHSA